MILQDLQSYLRDRSPTALSDLEQHFQIDAEALRGILGTLIRKGRVRKLETKKCGGCHSCSTANLELYEWIRPNS
jgi:ribosome biogenesis SPOUT family RNA methylase Rps3